MKRIVVLVILVVLGWQVYARYQRTATPDAQEGAQRRTEQGPSRLLQTTGTGSGVFKCDGRTYCSQMTSCAEANYFLKNCPGVKMDGNNDGIPCEKQWCR
jgi:hypothetical protein